MDIAFPALVIFLIALPGVILRFAYLRGFWLSNPFVITSVTDEVAYSLVGAGALHALWLRIASALGCPVDLHPLVVMLTGDYGYNDQYAASTIGAISLHLPALLTYFGTLYLASAAIGLGAKWAVRRFIWDIRLPWMRFRDEWGYMFRGEILQFPDFHLDSRPIDGVFIAAVVTLGDTAYLYRGILLSYYFDRSGALDKLVLTAVYRRKLADDRAVEAEHGPPDSTKGYYEIAGDFLVLRMTEIQTLNVEYFNVPLADLRASETDSVPTIADDFK